MNPSQGSPSGGSAEADIFFQQRLVLLNKLMFFLVAGIFLLSTILLGGLYSWSAVVADFGKAHRLMHAALAVFFGGIWFLGANWQLPKRVLTVIDAAGLLSTSVTVALMTAHADSGHGGALELVAAMMLILATRAIIIPSSGKQTLWLSAAASALCISAFTWRAVYHPVTLPLIEDQSPRDAAVTMALWMSMMVVTSTVASRIIFGLRHEIRVARRVGQYELIEKIGQGGMGVVYRARHALLRRETAIKLLPQANVSPQQLQRFEREVRLTARLTHPNTVAVFDYGHTPDGVFYYAMEYLDGLDLGQLVTYGGAVAVGRAVHILRQMLSSLTEAHESGLVHRDIKPANVIITRRGGEADVVKVVDFGLVKDLRGAESGGLTATDSIAGTPMYMAPETMQSADDVGPSADLYAVAAVGYFLLTATHVFKGNTVLEICTQHLYREPDPPSIRLGCSIPESLERLILSGLAKQPERRPRSARAFREALDRCTGFPRWTETDARDWWTLHRDGVQELRKGSPVDGSSHTVTVDLRERGRKAAVERSGSSLF